MLEAVPVSTGDTHRQTLWAESFVRLIESMDQAGWERSVTNIPKAISDREPTEFSTWSEIKTLFQ